MSQVPRWQIVLAFVLCLGALWLSLPTFLGKDRPDWLPEKTINLGLDLRGGSYLLLRVNFDAYLREQYANLQDGLRGKFLEQKIRYRGFNNSLNGVRVTLLDADEEKIAEALSDYGNEIAYDIENGVLRAQYRESTIAEMRRNVVEQSIEIVTRRVDETGTREPIIQRQGDDRVLVQVPGLDDPERLKRLIGKTAKMTFHLVNVNVSPGEIAAGQVPPGTRLLYGAEDKRDPLAGKERYAIYSRVMLSGEDLVDSKAAFDEGRPVVAFSFNTDGARVFGKITQDNVGKPFAIVLDNRVLTAPRIISPILNGSGIITGNFTVESANDLALLLRAGALPAPLEVIEERTVGPSLGADSIEAGKQASMLALALVMLFMLVYYGPLGVLANVALAANLLLLLAALALLQATLTLPGIAGIVLTLGMAVDANVLIFERMYEEHRLGKSPRAAVDQGYKTATATIIDANLTTLIAGVLLYYFGTGSVKGFAVTLSLGIITSMISTIFLAKMFMLLWLRWRRPARLPF